MGCGPKEIHVWASGALPPPPREEIWVLLRLVLSPGLPALLTASSPLGEVGVGPEGSSARHCSPYIKGGAGQGVRPAPVMGWDLSTNQEASLSPAPLGRPFLSPVPSSPGWHLTFWGSEGRPPQEVPRGEGPAPPGSLGESWPPGRRVCRDPSLCAWRWAKC